MPKQESVFVASIPDESYWTFKQDRMSSISPSPIHAENVAFFPTKIEGKLTDFQHGRKGATCLVSKHFRLGLIIEETRSN